MIIENSDSLIILWRIKGLKYNSFTVNKFSLMENEGFKI